MKAASEIVWTISSDVRSMQSEDGAVLLDIHQGLCFSLNVVGAKVWGKLEASYSGLTVPQLVNALARQFDVSADQLTIDLEHYLHELEAKGLVKAKHDLGLGGKPRRGMLPGPAE